ncbi:MAG: hypothetical protein ABIH34_03960 [Nanoarchaeota archaeon]
MHESQLKKLALSCAVMGIISLFFISQHIDIPSEGSVGDVILLQGEVIAFEEGETITKITLLTDDNDEKEIVAFNAPFLNIETLQRVGVEAEISEYKGEQELIAYRITRG